MAEHCASLAHPWWVPTTLASFLVAGILVSYLPQHILIYLRRSSAGLSPWWVLLGGLSSIAAIGNIVTLPATRQDLACCTDISYGACAAASLGVVQIGVQFACFMVLVVLYLFFYQHAIPGPGGDMEATAASLTQARNPVKYDRLVVYYGISLSFVIVAVVSPVLITHSPDLTQIWADILGTIAGVLAAIQYVPQIYYTWVLGDLGSLSIVTLVVQAPGAFLFAFSLFMRVGAEGWSTWLVYLVTGALQFVLLAMGLRYWHLDTVKRWEADQEQDGSPNGGAHQEADERTALLPSTEQRSAGP